MTFIESLRAADACTVALDWLATLGPEATLEQAWEKCPDATWSLWLVDRCPVVDGDDLHRARVLACAVISMQSLPNIEDEALREEVSAVCDLLTAWAQDRGIDIDRVEIRSAAETAWSAAETARSAAWSAAETAAATARSAARSAAESAAWSAESARSAAESAESARSAAESAAWSAAESAARSAAESAAWSAAWSAWSAAWSASLAASADIVRHFIPLDLVRARLPEVLR